MLERVLPKKASCEAELPSNDCHMCGSSLSKNRSQRTPTPRVQVHVSSDYSKDGAMLERVLPTKETRERGLPPNDYCMCGRTL